MIAGKVIGALGSNPSPLLFTFVVFILCCVLMAVINLAVDIIYAFCDPRIKAQYSGKG